MEKKTIRSGAPFVLAGCGVMAVALLTGMGSLVQYAGGLAVGAAAFAVGKRAFPDRVVEVERAPKSGNQDVDALITEARAQMEAIRAANDAIADPKLSAQIDDIVATCRVILSRLEEQPGMLSSLRTFLRYYLPTTQKLLDTRAKLEGEVASGHGAQINGRISEAVSAVQSAFHKQLEALNEFRFINLESEMDVLTQLIRSEGLGGEQVDVSGMDMGAAKTQGSEPRGDDPFASLFAQGEKK